MYTHNIYQLKKKKKYIRGFMEEIGISKEKEENNVTIISKI